MYDKWNTYAKSYDNLECVTAQKQTTCNKPAIVEHYSANDDEAKVLSIVDQYLKDIRQIPLLTKEEELYFARLAKKGDENARKTMIESNLRLVVKIARRYIRSELQLLDLIEEGNLGLMHAVEKFDPEKGFRFSTYSAWWIQQNIERAIMNQARTVRIPVHVVKKLNAFYRVRRDLSKELDHEPNTQELATKMNQSKEHIAQMMNLSEKAISLDAPTLDGIDRGLVDGLEDKSEQDPCIIFSKINLSDQINKWLHKLSPKHKDVLICRFGLMGQEPKTLDQTGSEVGLTRERVRQIQTEALRQLKKLIDKDGENKVNLLS